MPTFADLSKLGINAKRQNEGNDGSDDNSDLTDETESGGLGGMTGRAFINFNIMKNLTSPIARWLSSQIDEASNIMVLVREVRLSPSDRFTPC